MATVQSIIGIGTTRELYATVSREMDGWRVFHADGDIETAPDPRAAIRAISLKAKIHNPGCTIARITWFNVPADFQPPNVDIMLLTSQR